MACLSLAKLPSVRNSGELLEVQCGFERDFPFGAECWMIGERLNEGTSQFMNANQTQLCYPFREPLRRFLFS